MAEHTRVRPKHRIPPNVHSRALRDAAGSSGFTSPKIAPLWTIALSPAALQRRKGALYTPGGCENHDLQALSSGSRDPHESHSSSPQADVEEALASPGSPLDQA